MTRTTKILGAASAAVAVLCAVLLFLPAITDNGSAKDEPVYEVCEAKATPIPTPEPTPEPYIPGIELDDEYNFTLYDKTFNFYDEKLDLNHIKIRDNGELVRTVISCMPNIKYLDMDFCGVDDEHMAKIREDFPEIEVVWRIWFGGQYTVRTDCEKILASAPVLFGNILETNSKSLKYCTKIKYMDLGHNPEIGDISFIEYMPDLEVLIIAMDDVTDEMLKSVAYCKHLEFLEIQTNHITDLSPLSELHELKHLNIAYNFSLEDISPIYGLTGLKRLWIGSTCPVPEEQVEEMYERARKAGNNDLVINNTVYDPHDGWRWGNERYELLKKQLGYEEGDYQVKETDPKYLPEGKTWFDYY